MFKIQMKDAQSNNLTIQDSHYFNISLSCGTVTGTVVYNSDGLFDASFTPTTSGSSCSLSILLDGSGEVGPETVYVTPGPASYTTSTHSPTASVTAGIVNTFTIQAIDAASNTITVGGESFTFQLVHQTTSSIIFVGSVTDISDGTYTGSYNATTTGVYDLTVYLTSSGGLTAQYYSDASFTNLQETKEDSTVDFDWGFMAPQLTATFPADHFSIKWSGKIKADYSETFRIFTKLYANSGARITVDGTVLFDELNPLQGASDVFGDFLMSKDVLYDILIEFKEYSGTSRIVLEWSSPSTSRRVIPSANLYHITATSASPNTITVTPATSHVTTLTVTGAATTQAVAGVQQSLAIITRD
eukprot:471938_1